MRRGVLIAALGLMLVAVGPAAARVVQAETVLPPGQSGFVGPGGQSPYATDQLPLFEPQTFKPEPLGGGPGGSSETPRAGVTIRRDAFGVPAISATNEDLGWAGRDARSHAGLRRRRQRLDRAAQAVRCEAAARRGERGCGAHENLRLAQPGRLADEAAVPDR